MPYRLIRFALRKDYPEPRMFRTPDRLKPHYDVVIIRGGGHGLACAYYLARDYGITDVAVLEKSYIGSGGTGRNTAIIRSNYLTPEGVRFYDESVRLFKDLSSDLDLNLFYSQRGHFTLAHTDGALRTMRWRAEVNKHLGVDSEVVDRAFIKKKCDVRVIRQWSGLSDMTPDFSPIMGTTPIQGFYIDTGWGTGGFKATPVSGKTMAHTITNDEEHDLIKPFRLSRFEQFELVGEKGAASVGH